MKKLIILDRDGVINYDSPNYIRSEAEWRAIPGSLEAIAKLNQAGFTVLVATNQSGLARGLFNTSTLEAIHSKMQAELKQVGGVIDKIYFCPHSPIEACLCRKPNPGMLYQISKEYGIDFKTTEVLAIGDSLRDLQAAETAGCRPMLVLTGNGLKTKDALPASLQSIQQFQDLQSAVAHVIERV
jgi:D-glycero-D-manno-heptose 1,7-bisphosphate phosphatase